MFRFLILLERDREPGDQPGWWIKAAAVGLAVIGLAALILWRVLR